jgi:hypothetical protein
VYVVDQGNSRIQKFHETDVTAPDTQLDSGPSGISGANVSFVFSSTEPLLLGFECRRDAADWASCTSPKAYSSLSEGSHTFHVRAVDAAGNPDPTPETRTWTVDDTPPQTQIDSGPSGPTSNASPSFAFSSEAGASFQCRLDSSQEADFASCSSPHAYSSLADGAHTFDVRAVDPVGNPDPTPASRSFTIDTAAPQTQILSGPAGRTHDPTPTFTFTASEPGAHFACKVDSNPFVACNSPKTTTRLADGSHTFYVRAWDAIGNLDTTPATHVINVRTAVVRIMDSELRIVAAEGAGDNLRITRPFPSVLRVMDRGEGPYPGSGVNPGTGCTRHGDYTANCNAAGITTIRVVAGVRPDKVLNLTPIVGWIHGGAGNDLLIGGSARDTITGAGGADMLKGMNGNDHLLTRDKVSDVSIDCDGGNSAGFTDRGDLDLLPQDPNSAVRNCETKARH